MKYISEINRKENIVYIFDEKIKFEELDLDIDNFIKINLNDFNVSNTYNFFEKAVLESILNNSFSNIEFDYSNIKSEEFYIDETFKSLVEMFNKIIEKANKTINECKNNLKKEV
ncbi:MAG: hypothetical protein MJ244_02445 [Clostridia bacterium]|nr:hypothetical protein [Clostridia bacterium]